MSNIRSASFFDSTLLKTLFMLSIIVHRISLSAQKQRVNNIPLLNFGNYYEVTISCNELQAAEDFYDLISEKSDRGRFQLATVTDVFKIEKVAHLRTAILTCIKNATVVSDIVKHVFSNKGDQYNIWFPLVFFVLMNSSTDYRNNENERELLQEIAFNVLLNQEAILIIIGQEYEFSLTEFYSINGAPIFSTESYTYNVHSEKFLDIWRRKCLRRQNFRKASVSAVEIYDVLPQLARHITIQEGNKTVYVGGYDVEQFWFMRDSLNFTGVEMQASGWFGMDNELYTGMANQLFNKEANLSIASTRPFRTDDFSFLHPIQFARLYVFFVQPNRVYLRSIFTLPFNRDVWFTSLAVVLVLVISIVFFVRLKSKLFMKVTELDKSFSKETIMWALGIFTQKGLEFCPDSFSLKAIMMSGVMCSFLAFNAYSAFLTSFLSAETKAINTFEEVIANKYKIYASGYQSDANYSLETLRPKYKISSVMYVDSVASLLPTISSTHSAFIGITEEMYRAGLYTKNIKSIFGSKLSVLSVGDILTKAGAFVKRGSPLKEFFNYKIINMFENGLQFRLMVNYARAMAQESKGEANFEVKSISYNDIFTAAMTMLAGCFCSCFVCILERIYKLIQFRRNMIVQ